MLYDSSPAAAVATAIAPILKNLPLDVHGHVLELLTETLILSLPLGEPLTEEIALKGARAIAGDIEDHLRAYFAQQRQP